MKYDDMNFEEKELSILRNAVDNITSQAAKKIMNSPEITKIINIVEKFLRDKKRICYGFSLLPISPHTKGI